MSTTRSLKTVGAKGIRFAFIIALILFAVRPVSAATVYDVSADYSSASNPAGPWSYGFLTGLTNGQFGILGHQRTFSSENGQPLATWEVSLFSSPPVVAKNVGTNDALSPVGQFSAPVGTVYFAPGADGSTQNFGAIRLTMPVGSAGTYLLETSVKSLFDGTRSRDSDFHVLKNGAEVFGQFLGPNSVTGYTNTLSLAPGDIIDFAVGRGADGLTIDTGLKIAAKVSLVAGVPDACVDGLAGIVGWWPGDSGGTDRTAKNPATLTNGVAVVAGKVGSAFSFDGVNDYVLVPASASMNVGTNGGFTVEAWINPANVSGAMPVFEWRWIPGAEVGVHLWFNQSQAGDVYANILDAVPQSHIIQSAGGVVKAATYQHVALTYDRGSGVANIYVNGTNVATANLGSFVPNTARDFLIGKRIDSAGGNGAVFSGQIDEPSVYSRALAAAEIQAISLAGSYGKCGPTTTAEITHDFSSSFSIASNPNGNWSYGSKATLDGSLSLMKIKGAVPGNNGKLLEYWQVAPSVEPTIFHNTNSVAVTFTGGHVDTNETYMFSGSNGQTNKFGVIRYTVPSAGQYRIQAGGKPVYDSAAAGQGDTDFHVVRNGVELFGQNVAAMGVVGYSNVVVLSAGDLVELVLGPGLDGQGGYAGSGLKLDFVLTQLSSTPAAPVIVDFSKEFSIASNPNGNWSYGSKPTLGGSLSLMKIKGAVPGNNGKLLEYWQVAPSVEPTIFHNTNSVAVTFTGGRVDAGETYMYSGANGQTNKFGVIRFTVPSAGQYRIQAGGKPVYDSAAAGQGDTDFHVVRNGVELFGQDVAAMGVVGYSNVVVLSAGDLVELVLGPGLDGLGSSAGSGLKLDFTLTQLSSTPSASSMLVVPTIYKETPGGTHSGLLAEDLRLQAVYGSNLFPQRPIVIKEIRFRPNAQYGGAFSATIPGFRISLSTTAKQPDGLSTTFAQNVGADVKEVFNGNATVSSAFVSAAGGTKAFDIKIVFSQPFLYDPALGNLLVDFVNPAASGGTRLDAGTSSSDSASRIFGRYNDAVASGGDSWTEIIEVVYSTGPESPAAPTIVVQPVGSTNEIGASISLSVVAEGSSPLAYQWFKGVGSISGATNTSLALTNLQVADSGAYSAVVSNPSGSVTSLVASILVNPNTVTNGALVVPTIYKETPGGTHSGLLAENLRLQAVYGSNLFPQRPIVIKEIRFRPNAQYGGAFSATIPGFRISLSTTTNQPDGLSATFAQNVGTDVKEVFNGDAAISSSFVNAAGGTKAFDIKFVLSQPFRYDPALGNLLFDFVNPAVSGGTRIDAGTSSSDSASRIFGRYNDAIAGGGDSWTEVIEIVYLAEPLEPTAPTILVQPVSSTNELGSSLALNVTAYGSSTLRYQWRFEGDAILGATNASLSLDNLQLTNAGAYSVVVSNTLGSVTSSNAFVSVVALPPYIVSQPANVSAVVGTTASFAVTAGGAKPLSYQWFLGGSGAVVGGTNATLAVTNVGPSVAGDYTVVVANSLGMATSSVARLTVTYPPALISIGGTNAVSGRLVSLPVTIRANGNENALSFSLTYTPSRLLFVGASLGSGVEGGALLINDSQTNSGRVGLAMALPADTTFAAGTQQVLTVQFYAPFFATGSPVATSVGFTGTPVAQNLTDSSAASLLKSFSSAATVLLSPSPLEGDVYPRPNGSRTLDINDWVQVGRFVAGLDQASSGDEFQRIDSAPRETKGDGQLKVTDWVQAGRYAVGLDPISSVGGPTSVVTQMSVSLSGRSGLAQNATRTLKAMNASAVHGLAVNIPVVLDAQGNENAVGFSLGFDTNAFTYVSTAKGSGFAAGSMQVNALQAGSGRVGVVLALPSGGKLPAGSVAVANITLQAKSPEAGNYSVSFVNGPSALGVSDAEANELVAVPMAASVAVNPAPTLTAVKAGETVKLSWPTWAEGFVLQGGSLGGAGWTNVPAGGAATNGGSVEVVLPLSGEPAFFRLQHP